MMYRPAFGSAIRANPEDSTPAIETESAPAIETESAPAPSVGSERDDVVEVEVEAPAVPTPFADALNAETSPFRDAPMLVKNAFASCMQLMVDNKIADNPTVISAVGDALYWFQNIGFPNYDYEVLCDVYANVLRGIDLDPPLHELIQAQWCTDEAKASLRTYAPTWTVNFTDSLGEDPFPVEYTGEDAINQLNALLCGDDVGDAQKEFLIKSRSLDLYYLFAEYPTDPVSYAGAEDVYFFNAFNAALEGVTLDAISEDALLDVYVAGKLVGRPIPSRKALLSAVALLAGTAALLRVAAIRLKG